MTWIEIMMLIFASFRLTRLIVYDQITSFIRKPFHELVEEEDAEGNVETYLEIRGSGLRHWIGELLSCYWCTGMWSTILLVLGIWFLPEIFEFIVFILALAGGAAFLEVIVQKLNE
ncbi:DUF1360 domain-containing protein [Bacillus solimangrovi]|uniref:Sporulation protein n=1 Tax=Bacillus solimangrovi TaxID=1305675 RepID=A0A1E5LBZ3_9BACI|nr:DUF1360 domain-containing protein [Bacillus solimangrovi]OEH91595.1 sporulation protein [Bacillus solimangrovi]